MILWLGESSSCCLDVGLLEAAWVLEELLGSQVTLALRASHKLTVVLSPPDPVVTNKIKALAAEAAVLALAALLPFSVLQFLIPRHKLLREGHKEKDVRRWWCPPPREYCSPEVIFGLTSFHV